PVAIANAELTSWLQGLEETAGAGTIGQAAFLGAILGAMMAFDMGGPVNKVAYVFSVGLIGEQIYGPMAAVMIAGMTPPLGMALSNFLAEHKYPEEMYENAKSATVMGFSFITEGAIPYAASDPGRVIPSLMAGSATAGALSMALGVGMPAPHGGIFVLPLARGGGAIPGPLAFLGSIAVGAIITAITVTVLKPDHVPEAEATGDAATAD
ncbi:MAG: fructose-specific PTS transporter subunit EIIC, partial [Halapricum sp.]